MGLVVSLWGWCGIRIGLWRVGSVLGSVVAVSVWSALGVGIVLFFGWVFGWSLFGLSRIGCTVIYYRGGTVVYCTVSHVC